MGLARGFAPNLRRLKWVAVLTPVVFLGLVDVLRHTFYPEFLHAWPGYFLVAGVVLGGALLFTEVVFSAVSRVQDRLAQQNRELLSLHEAGLAIAGELGLEAVLQKVVDQARDLVGARYGALSILGTDGAIELFLTSGLSSEERERIGALPVGRGLLGVVLQHGERLRLGDLNRDPRSVGFPAHHPAMRSLVAVPVLARGHVLGNLYLTEKMGAAEFTAEDEETLERFGTQAALAIENARLHRQVQAVAVTEERERIAREMHDSLAQVLGYVNTKAQAAQGFLESGQPARAVEQIEQLSEAAREAYADVRESILGLRTSLGPGRELGTALREHVQQWQDQNGVIVDLETPDILASALSPSAELQLLRIVQESLTNVRKHAAATRVSVRVRRVDGWCETVIEDNGTGFAQNAPAQGEQPRFGLATMRERAESVGGTLAVESARGTGTRVTARLPLS